MNLNKKIAKKVEALKELVLQKAKIKHGTQADNIKLGNMGSWAMLFGNCNWYIPELDIEVKGTCGNHCAGCFNPDSPKHSDCYVAKSYYIHTNRNEDGTVGDIVKNKCSVKLGHAYRTIAMTMFREDLLLSLDKQLTKKKEKFKIIRINESGEITDPEDLFMWNELARRHPETVFYLYTKNYDAVRKLLAKGVSDNLFINISVWHEFGIAAYLEMKGYKQIRVFAVVDDEWTVERYAEEGLYITSMCPAYDKKGKMNHDITCERCKKCFSSKGKCTGCYKH